MDSQKSKNIIIILLMVIIIILATLVVLFATGTISFSSDLINSDKQTSESNDINENIKGDISDNNSYINNITTEKIKEIFKFAYEYYKFPVVYCGETEVTSIELYGTNRFISKEFTNYDEMLNSLKKYMSIDLITKKSPFSSTTKEYYLEQDGKLYCENTYKGYSYTHGNIEIEILSKTEGKVTCIASMEVISPENNITYDKVNLVLELNNNDWIITSYDEINQ